MLRKWFGRTSKAVQAHVQKSMEMLGVIEFVQWEFVNSPQPLVGLAQLQFHVRASQFASREVEICLIRDRATIGLRKVPLDDAGGGTAWFALHTHVLDNGPHSLMATLLDAETKAELWRGEVEFDVSNVGELAESVSANFRRNEVGLVVDTFCDAESYDYADDTLKPWYDRPDAMEQIAAWEASGALPADIAAHFRHFVTEGYIVLEGLIDHELIDAVNSEIDDALASHYQGYEYGSSQRIEHLHTHYENARKLFLDRRYLDILDRLYRATARPCQTLTYVFGSQQDAHQDTVHLTPFPAGYMCGVWIALQDVVPNSGELAVYPRSHRLPRVYMHDVACAKVNGDWREFGEKVVGYWRELVSRNGLKAEPYLPKKGTVLIWHENLMHEGSVRRNPELPRRSMVIHTFADGAVVFYDSSGLVGHAVHRSELRRD
ncbi:phytanoyl-CoA dioxygenase family protein [Chitinimonas sp. BJYL2]|uniref:phytanoyl-CoA dioxygenase family protein n=1 Tax=Chitinimonas sp. BJYL2 TaxID=2976696 RepID=UPI0022B3F695|nr:phytanoyl-CoA dioxygenase family protein [Chitinimonas sp. BJYL2]